MKIQEIKNKVYGLTKTKTTKQLKSKRPELVTGRDMRRKDSWLTIHTTLKLINDFHQEQISKEVTTKHKFKMLDSNSSFADLISNVRSLGDFYHALESKVENTEQKIKRNNNEF